MVIHKKIIYDSDGKPSEVIIPYSDYKNIETLIDLESSKEEKFDKENILEIIKSNKRNIRSFGVSKIGLFGSYIRGEETDNSDIDLLVIFDEGKETFDNFMNLCFFLEGLFPSKKVEVVTLDGLSKYIRPYIEKEVVYEELY